MIKKFKYRYIKDLLIYHIYRYFKYKINYFRSYGATGEDVLINKIFKNNTGLFIDVGALHPVNGSLTYNLYKKGWKGFNFDIVQKNIRLFNIFRKRDTSINVALSSQSGFINSYIFGSGSGLNTLEKEWAEKWAKTINREYKTQKIKKTTISEIVKKYRIPKNIELLNIDVEGHEIDVLKGINFKLFRPKIITIEIHVKNTRDIFKTKVYEILKKSKYELISQYYHTSFFKADEFLIKEL